jgi:hypothetical protein
MRNAQGEEQRPTALAVQLEINCWVPDLEFGELFSR